MKRFFLRAAALLLIAVLLLPVSVFAEGALAGDANVDGAVNPKDITTLRRYLAGGYGVEVVLPIPDVAKAENDELSVLIPGSGSGERPRYALADINNDKQINPKDITMLRRYLAGGYGVEPVLSEVFYWTSGDLATDLEHLMNTTPPTHPLPTVEELEQTDEVYYVGATRENTSLVSLLLDLTGDENRKTIFIDAGEYDIFAEYMAEVEAGRIAVPADDINNSTYMEAADGKWYNAFVPNNTVLYGLGDVTLRFTPAADEITYGESRVWSPLNPFGSVEMYNLNVLVKNGRYCLHNDDHNRYPNSFQYYYNCRFEYQLGDMKDDQLLGFNSTIGYGIDDNSTHFFENCEMYFNGEGNHGVFYGHDAGAAANSSWIFLKGCYIHASDPTNARVIRLQTLAKNVSDRPVYVTVQDCTVNGGLQLNMYYAESIQTYDVTYRYTPKMPVTRTNAYGPVVDPYTIKYEN